MGDRGESRDPDREQTFGLLALEALFVGLVCLAGLAFDEEMGLAFLWYGLPVAGVALGYARARRSRPGGQQRRFVAALLLLLVATCVAVLLWRMSWRLSGLLMLVFGGGYLVGQWLGSLFIQEGRPRAGRRKVVLPKD